jgi:hypothetical protein
VIYTTGETFGVSLVDLIYVNCQVIILIDDHGSAALPMKFDRPTCSMAAVEVLFWFVDVLFTKF